MKKIVFLFQNQFSSEYVKFFLIFQDAVRGDLRGDSENEEEVADEEIPK